MPTPISRLRPWFFQRFAQWQLLHVQPSTKTAFSQSVHLRPFRDCSRGFVQGQDMARSPVIGLLLSSGPTTVFWRVRAIVVDAIKRVSASWARPHVGQERLKTVAPTRDHNYSTATVALVSLSGWSMASTLCCVPRFIGWCTSHSMRKVCCSNAFTSKTPTALRLAITKFRSVIDACAAALAPAIPSQAQSLVSGTRDNGQAVKCLTRDVDKSAHVLDYSTLGGGLLA